MVDPDAAVAGALGGHQGEPVVPVVLCGREQRGASARGCAPPEPAGCGRGAGHGKRGYLPALTVHRLLQALAEAPQLLLADPAGGPQEAGDERGRRGDLGPHVLPGPAASAARPGLRGRGRLRATAARRGRDGAGLLCWRRGWSGADARTDSPRHGQPEARTARPAGQRSVAPAGRGPAAPPGPALIHPNGNNG